MKLVVGFLTYNESSAKYLTDFLPSLKKALEFLPAADCQVLAFDNSSTENNLNRLALELFNRDNGNFVEYLSAGENLGFSRAYNLLINRASQRGAEYFLVINPDTWLEPDAIKELVAALDKNPGLATASPKIRRWEFSTNTKTKDIDSCGLILKSGLKFLDLGQGQEDRNQFDRASIIAPSGAAGLFRLSALEKIKVGDQYFDERFFMYKEDCDLAYRLYRAGLVSSLIPTAIVYHDRTAASSGTGLWRTLGSRFKKSRQVRSWSFLNQHLIFVKHWPEQKLCSKVLIVCRMLSFFIFSLILEQFLLKNYSQIFPNKKS